MVKQEIKDWLRNAGSEVAKAAGQHVLKHGLQYIAAQLQIRYTAGTYPFFLIPSH